jgi:hypothetical protein
LIHIGSQTKDNIANIKEMCREIDQKLKTFSTKAKDDDDISADGGTITEMAKEAKD